MEELLNKETKTLTIAVDAMGGDNAPDQIVAGAVKASQGEGINIALVGDHKLVSEELDKHDTNGLPIQIVPSDGVILEGESPTVAFRQKPESSILVSTGLVKKGIADASVTMGSTGAAMAAGALILGVIEGIDRPALGGPIIGLSPNTIVIEVGANVDCKPHQLVCFAIIGDVFARQFWSIDNPKVAILSVGTEDGKGNRQTKETADLISETELNFIGNIEASDLPFEQANVVICDGFIGNVVMKLTEGLGLAISKHILKEFKNKIPHRDLEQVAENIYNVNNVAETWGGGPLFGIKGVSVVGHGKANKEAVQRAIETAAHAVRVNLVPKLNQELSSLNIKAGK